MTYTNNVTAFVGISISIHLGYAEKWAKARLEQQEFKLNLQKEDALSELNDYSKEYNAEQVIWTEISGYLEADVKEKEEQLIAWTKKYNEEIVNRQQEIDDLRVHSNLNTVNNNRRVRNAKYNK